MCCLPQRSFINNSPLSRTSITATRTKSWKRSEPSPVQLMSKTRRPMATFGDTSNPLSSPIRVAAETNKAVGFGRLKLSPVPEHGMAIEEQFALRRSRSSIWSYRSQHHAAAGLTCAPSFTALFSRSRDRWGSTVPLHSGWVEGLDQKIISAVWTFRLFESVRCCLLEVHMPSRLECQPSIHRYIVSRFQVIRTCEQ
jgi:hypothetical protein